MDKNIFKFGEYTIITPKDMSIGSFPLKSNNEIDERMLYLTREEVITKNSFTHSCILHITEDDELKIVDSWRVNFVVSNKELELIYDFDY